MALGINKVGLSLVLGAASIYSGAECLQSLVRLVLFWIKGERHPSCSKMSVYLESLSFTVPNHSYPSLYDRSSYQSNLDLCSLEAYIEASRGF